MRARTSTSGPTPKGGAGQPLGTGTIGGMIA